MAIRACSASRGCGTLATARQLLEHSLVRGMILEHKRSMPGITCPRGPRVAALPEARSSESCLRLRDGRGGMWGLMTRAIIAIPWEEARGDSCILGVYESTYAISDTFRRITNARGGSGRRGDFYLELIFGWCPHRLLFAAVRSMHRTLFLRRGTLCPEGVHIANLLIPNIIKRKCFTCGALCDSSHGSAAVRSPSKLRIQGTDATDETYASSHQWQSWAALGRRHPLGT